MCCRIAKRKVVFRADASHRIGMGHFVRTLALAEMLKDEFFCVFATCAPTPYQITEIEKVCASRIDLPDDSSHFSTFLDYLNGDEIVVLDNYYFDTDYQQVIKDKGCKLVCIDDTHDKHYVSDLVINHAPLDVGRFSVEPYTKVLLGYDYAMLRNVFLDSSAVVKKRNTPFRTALVCVGGADVFNLTSSFFKDLVTFEQIEKIILITGNAFAFSEQLSSLIERYKCSKEILWLKDIDAFGMVEAMSLSDFGVLPCSTVLMEALSQKLPVITGAYVDNQLEISSVVAGMSPYVQVKDCFRGGHVLLSDIKALELAILSYDYPALISQDAVSHLRRAFDRLGCELGCHLRQADGNDVGLYYSWASDPLVRSNAFNSKEILYEDHVDWFNSKLKAFKTFMYVLEVNDSSVGQIRFDEDGGFYIIDYSVAKEFHGYGYGAVLVKMGVEALLHDTVTHDAKRACFRAVVKDCNIPSVKVFEYLGFCVKRTFFVETEKCIEFEK